ncbi:unnamed protein product [Symbiodinium sp. CCMP2592]|nr:unnamed protein product [Symbiodinium sp. CCMP2592]
MLLLKLSFEFAGSSLASVIFGVIDMSLSHEVKVQLQSFLEEAADGEKMVKVVEATLDLLRKNHLLSTMKLEPKLVGVHPSNRDGYGVNPQDVLDLVDSIIDVGFVKGRVHAVGVEVESQHVRDWNSNLFASANGGLGSMEPDLLKVTSICGSHTNSALRLFRDAVPHSNELVCTGGRLSMEMLKNRDPAFHEAATEGLSWDVISAAVAREVPEILELVSRSGNTSLQRGEHELQVLRRIHGLYCKMQASGQTPSFASLKKQILASKPKCGVSVPHMYSYCLKCSGGQEAVHLKETELFVRACCPSSRQLGPDLWQALSMEIKGHGSEAVACFRNGLVKSAYVRQNVSVGDCRKLAANFTKVKEADEIMLAVRAMLTEQLGEWKDAGLVKALATMDMCMCSMVLGLKQKGEKDYRTLQAVAHDFCLVAQELTGRSLPLKWQGFAEATAAPAAAKASSSSAPVLLELDEHGAIKNPVGLLESRGYALGSNVRRRADKTTGKIQDVKGGLVYIQLDSGDVAKEPIDKILGNEWAVFTPKSEAEVLEDLSIYSPSTNVELQAFMLQAEIARQLQKLFDEQSSGIDKLALQTKPQKQLQASQDIPKGKVTLVPLTSKILHKGSSQASWFEVTTDWTMDARKFYLSSSCVLPKEDDDKIKPLIVPFFFVNYTEDEDEANVKLQPMQAEKSSSIKIPVFKSTKKIAAGEVVLCYKAKDLKAPPLHLSPSAAKRSSSGGVAVAAKKKAKKFAMAEDPTFEVETRKIIFFGKHEWCPTQKIVEERTFFSFTKWSAQLTRMMTGKRLQLGGGRAAESGSLNVPVIGKILEARQSACDKALEEALKVEDGSGDEDEKPKKKAKKTIRRSSAKDLHLLPEIVDVSVAEFQMSLLSEGLSTGTIWMELRPENLSWLKSCVDKEEAKPRQKKGAGSCFAMLAFGFLDGHLPTAEEAESFEACGLMEPFTNKAKGKWYNDKGAGISWSATMGWKVLGAGGEILWTHPEKQREDVPTSGWVYWDGTPGAICVEGTS